LEAAAAVGRRQTLQEEVATLESDEADLREMREVTNLMEHLRAEG
jgi:hypothetical protein